MTTPACDALKYYLQKPCKCFLRLITFTMLSLGSLRKDDGNRNDDAREQWSDWLNGEKQSCCMCGTHFSTIPWRSLSNDDVKFPKLERLSTAYFFPANDREGHVTWQFPRLPFAGRRFYSRRTFFPFGGNAKTWVFAAHFYCLFLHFDRLLL